MNRSEILDSLRIFAIVLVFIAHFGQILDTAAGDFFGVKNLYYVSLGGVGVSLFLILSGILASLTDGSKKTSYTTYMLKKVLRIYPLYWMSVPLAILGYVLGEWLLDGDMPKLFPNGITVDLIGSVTGFYSWGGLWGGPYNSPSWFIALIMVMYALFPLLLFCMRRQAHLTLAVLLLISLYSRYYVGQQGLPFDDQSFYEGIKSWFYRQYGFMPGRPGDWFPPCRLFEFGLGIYLALIVPKAAWFKLKLPFNKPLTFLSDLAFPLFLFHYPFMFFVVYLEDKGLPLWLSIIIFMIVLTLLCYWINLLDQKIPRKRITSMLSPNSSTKTSSSIKTSS